MTKQINLIDVVNKLIGPIDPVGETNEDGRRFENLKAHIELIEDMVQQLHDVARNETRVEYSMKIAGQEAAKLLRSYKLVDPLVPCYGKVVTVRTDCETTFTVSFKDEWDFKQFTERLRRHVQATEIFALDVPEDYEEMYHMMKDEGERAGLVEAWVLRDQVYGEETTDSYAVDFAKLAEDYCA